MPTMRLVVASVMIAVATASCSGTTTSTGQPAQEVATPTTVQTPSTTEAPSTTEGSPAPDLRALGGVGGIELVDSAPGGLRPLLAWAEVPDAAYYRVVVLDGDGKPYWGWIGTEASVRFGGAETDSGLTAQVHEPMTWSVVAIDSQGRTIALSDPGSLPGEG